jgi:chemotaxis protein MotB
VVRSTSRSFGLLAIVAAFVLPGCVAATKYNQLADDLVRAQEELGYAQQQLADAEGLLQNAYVDEDALAEALNRASAAEQARRDLEAQYSEIQGKSSLLAQRGVDVVYHAESNLAGFSAGSDVFFVSGSDALSKDGKSALDLIVAELNNLDGPIRVDGHTDSDPVSKTKDKYPHGNIQLGALRAISVRNYLVEKGIPEGRVWIASHGPYKPVQQGNTDEAKARNRRVEILVPVGKPAQG